MSKMHEAFRTYAIAARAIRNGTATRHHFADLMAIMCDPNIKPKLKLAAAEAHCEGSIPSPAPEAMAAQHG